MLARISGVCIIFVHTCCYRSLSEMELLTCRRFWLYKRGRRTQEYAYPPAAHVTIATRYLRYVWRYRGVLQIGANCVISMLVKSTCTRHFCRAFSPRALPPTGTWNMLTLFLTLIPCVESVIGRRGTTFSHLQFIAQTQSVHELTLLQCKRKAYDCGQGRKRECTVPHL